MSILNGLHGTPALLLLCGLLFAEEAGVPLPFAPGELVVLAGGLLIATGGLNPFIFIPAAIVACVAGSLLGFGWASAVGPTGLRTIARKLHKEKALEKVEQRVTAAGPVGIGVSRLIPGLRIYTTLVAGALRMEKRTFLGGVIPTTVAWVVTFAVLGAVVGIPVEHFFNRAAMLALEGVILVAMGVGAYLAIRHTPPPSESGILRAPRYMRIMVATIIDLAVLASVVIGVTQVGGRIITLSFGPEWLEGPGILFASVVFYVVVARRGPGATVGESLMQTTYISGRGGALRPAALLSAARGSMKSSPVELGATAQALRSLGEPSRLQLVSHILQESHTMNELARLTGSPPAEVSHRLGPLLNAGVVVVEDDRYHVEASMAKPLILMIAQGETVTSRSDLAEPVADSRVPRRADSGSTKK